MTDNRIEKIRAEVERLKSQLLRGACSSQIAMETKCKEEAYDEVLALLDSLQEEPKKCMYARDNYTDEDRKVLCDGCEEECIEKVNEERKRDLSLWSLEDFENNFFEIIKPYKDSRNYKNLCIRLVLWRSELWRWIHWKKRKEETVSEDLNTELDKYIKEHFTIDKEQLDRFGLEEKDYMYSMDKSDMLILIHHFADWQKQQILKAMDLGEPPYLISVEQAYYNVKKMLED